MDALVVFPVMIANFGNRVSQKFAFLHLIVVYTVQ